MIYKLTDEEKEEKKLEKEHKLEMRRLKSMVTCSCGYIAQGKNLRIQFDDMYSHIRKEHPERRKFEL
jgi:hypothetical protein